MKPPGGNYKPNRININKIPARMGGAPIAKNANAHINTSVANGEECLPDSGEGAAGADRLGKGDAGYNAAGPGNGTADVLYVEKPDEYKAAKVMTASPAELILMMFEQFFELIPDIKSSIRRKSPAAMESDAERAQAIIDELINALDFDIEMSADIGAIYFYVRNRILEANVKFSAGVWDHIESVMRPLYEGFKEAFSQIDAAFGAPEMSDTNPSIIAGMTYGQSALKEVVVNTRSGLRV